MSRLLIVDDEGSYRRQLELALATDGWEVATASGGREAIDFGARFRPDVLVTDWMLCDDIHGLYVAQVLRLVVPDCRTILITGFPSDDLRNDAKQLGVAEFIEKPFTLDRIRAAARDKRSPPGRSSSQLPVALLEVSSSGEIMLANPRALEIIAGACGDAEPATITELFPASERFSLDRAVDRWLAVSPRGGGRWHVRAQPASGERSRFVVLREQGDPQHIAGTLIDMLFGLKDTAYGRWPLEDRVLVVTDTSLARRLIVPILENAGAGCYGAASVDDATRLLTNDPGISFVVMDIESPDENLSRWVGQARAVREDLVIVGSGHGQDRNRFAEAGVELFLAKPWRAVALANVLTGRLGDCANCGCPLPLRHPQQDETSEKWVCVACGAVHTGVYDDAFPEEFARNVTAID